MEPRCNEGSRDWQHLLAITWFSLSVYYYWRKENRYLKRELRYIEVRYIEVPLYCDINCFM